MSSMALTPVSYLVLGLVAGGARTSYELKPKVASSVGYMWTFPHSALHAEPGRLAAFGLLHEQREQAGRHRRITRSQTQADQRSTRGCGNRPSNRPNCATSA